MTSPSQTPGCLAYGLFVVAILWICLVVGLGAPMMWVTREVVLISGFEWPLWASPLAALVQALAILLLVGPLAAFTQAPHLRSAYRAWAAACGLLVAYGLARGMPMTWSQPAALAQIGVGLLAGLLLWLGLRRARAAADQGPMTEDQGPATRDQGRGAVGPSSFVPGPVAADQGRGAAGPSSFVPGPVAADQGRGAAGPSSFVALALALLLGLPWLAFGALGSPTDTLLALGAGAGVGLAGAWLLGLAGPGGGGPGGQGARGPGGRGDRSAQPGGHGPYHAAGESPLSRVRERGTGGEGHGASPDTMDHPAAQAFAPPSGGAEDANSPTIGEVPQNFTGADVGFAGLSLGTALLIVAAGAGFEAANLLLMAALPPLGFAAAALGLPLAGLRRAWLPPALLVGGVAAAAMALFDPDEVTLLLGGSDMPSQALAATSWAFLLNLVAGAALWASYRAIAGMAAAPALTGDRRGVAPALGGLAGAALVAALVYALAGDPGFYGEKLFVILDTQADLGAVPAIGDREERLRAAYTALVAHADATQAGLRADLDRFGVRYTPYYLVNALEVDGGPLVRLWLSTRPEVDRVLDSPRLRPLPTPPPPEPGDTTTPEGAGWNISMIGADRVWDELGVTGEGIVIGQSDSGVDGGHPALRARYRGAGGGDAYNWLDPWYGSAAPRDYGMHGTHTLGTALGAGGIGVAPGATWFACANLARNLGNPAHYLDCMQFMLAPHAPGADPLRAGDPARAAHVLNNSWGCPPLEGCDPTSLQPAADALRAAGIFVVASAGNEGPACGSIRAPIALYDSVFSVGAVDENGDLTDFSSRGPVAADGSGRPKPDIVAPGADILSAQPGGLYGRADGTSMAGPHVAGVVALIWSANPALVGDIDRTEQILRETARPYTGTNEGACSTGANGAGAGLVDAYAAVRMALENR